MTAQPPPPCGRTPPPPRGARRECERARTHVRMRVRACGRRVRRWGWGWWRKHTRWGCSVCACSLFLGLTGAPLHPPVRWTLCRSRASRPHRPVSLAWLRVLVCFVIAPSCTSPQTCMLRWLPTSRGAAFFEQLGERMAAGLCVRVCDLAASSQSGRLASCPSSAAMRALRLILLSRPAAPVVPPRIMRIAAAVHLCQAHADVPRTARPCAMPLQPAGQVQWRHHCKTWRCPTHGRVPCSPTLVAARGASRGGEAPARACDCWQGHAGVVGRQGSGRRWEGRGQRPARVAAAARWRWPQAPTTWRFPQPPPPKSWISMPGYKPTSFLEFCSAQPPVVWESVCVPGTACRRRVAH